MKTKTKVAIASMAYRVVSLLRGLAGRTGTATVVRGGIRWDLDLSEGIDFAIYLLGAFERSTAAALNQLVRPGDTVFDIGANIGAHTLPMARRAGSDGRVFAFEPAGFAFSKLQRNIALNPDLQARIYPHQVMLTDNLNRPVEDQIYASWPLAGAQPVHPKHRGRLTGTRGAHSDTIDSFVARERIGRLDLIKIDVDGNEYPVLNGGAQALARLRPILVMEVSPYVHLEHGNHFGNLVDLLKRTGYSLQEVGSRRPLPLVAKVLEKMIPDGSSINAIARAK